MKVPLISVFPKILIVLFPCEIPVEARSPPEAKRGWLCHTCEFVHVSFFGWCSYFLLYDIKWPLTPGGGVRGGWQSATISSADIGPGLKSQPMGTNGGGGVVVVCALRRLQAILVPGSNPNRMQIFFSLIFVYKLTSTNSYILWCLYQFVHFLYTNWLVRIRTYYDVCTNLYIFMW